MSKRLPNALCVFCLIKDFYFLERITKDCVAITLIVVLIFFEYKHNLIRLASLIVLLIILQDYLDLLFGKQYFASLFRCLD